MGLNVYRNSTLVGTLKMEGDEPFYGFTYSTTYLESKGAMPLSLSLPLASTRYSGQQALPYFEGLLPEGDVRYAIAKQFHVSPHSPAQLISVIGRDCAGGVSVLDEDDPAQPPANNKYAPLPLGLNNLSRNPFDEAAHLRRAYRLSLAGGQEKAALYHDDRESLDTGWYIPLDGSPSNYIIKPQVTNRFPDLALNEFLCMRASSLMDIAAADVSLLYPNNPLLLIRRFDRSTEEPVVSAPTISSDEVASDGLATLSRLHQEDFCQALGHPSIDKYELPNSSYADEMLQLMLNNGRHPAEDLQRLFEIMLFNFLIGNCDAHLKNFSIIWASGNSIRLSPAYDLVSTTIYDGTFGQQLSRSMGIRVGEHLNIDKVTKDDILLLSKCLHQPPFAIKTTIDHLLSSFESAFASASDDAQELGFANASSLNERIVSDAQKRAHLLDEARSSC